jgi:hypothetical protein
MKKAITVLSLWILIITIFYFLFSLINGSIEAYSWNESYKSGFVVLSIFTLFALSFATALINDQLK